MNGAVWLQSWTSSSSTGSTSSTTWLQLLCGVRGRARGRRRRSRCRRRCAPATPTRPSAPARVSACGVGDQWPRRASGTRSRRPRARASRPRAADPPAAAPAAARDQVRVGLGRAAHGLRGVVDEDVERARRAATSSASAMTWPGSRRSMPDDPQPVQPVGAVVHRGEAARRRRCGKRVVIVVCAPSRSSRSAMYIPIFARPPVSSARRPVRSVRASRRAWLSAAQAGQSWW